MPPSNPLDRNTLGAQSASEPMWPKSAWSTAKSNCAPGHSFSLYFPIWKSCSELPKNKKLEALKACLPFNSVAPLVTSLRARQSACLSARPKDSVLIIEAESTSPFSTGLGIEHPIENGFAFLSPYGIPYLAGSGVKGVLRHAAETFVLAEKLTPAQVEILFGTEFGADSEVLKRGALEFWDVFPLPPETEIGRSLSIEVMTPHHSKYLFHETTPHNSESPNPIPFLAVPPSSSFRFIVTCAASRIPVSALAAPWHEILKDMFQLAFDYLGFGAKTAVGYGALRSLSDEEARKACLAAAAEAVKCSWVDDTIQRLKTPQTQAQNQLFGRGLADAWKAISDPELKAAALADIRSRWGDEWNDQQLRGARKVARSIYEES